MGPLSRTVGLAVTANLVIALTSLAWGQTQQVQPPVGTQRAQSPEQDHTGMLLGRWGDNGGCKENLVQFNANGTFHSFDTGNDGHWTLNGERLTMQGEGGVFDLTLHWIDSDHIEVSFGDGSTGHSQRCPES